MKLPNISRRAKLGYKNCSGHNGFSLIEVLIAITILTLIIGLGLFLSLDFYRVYAFRYETSLLVSVLQTARSRSMSNIDQVAHSFRYADGQYIILPENQIIPTSHSLSISGDNNILFEQLSGSVVGEKTINVTDGVRSVDILINEEGGIIW